MDQDVLDGHKQEDSPRSVKKKQSKDKNKRGEADLSQSLQHQQGEAEEEKQSDTFANGTPSKKKSQSDIFRVPEFFMPRTLPVNETTQQMQEEGQELGLALQRKHTVLRQLSAHHTPEYCFGLEKHEENLSSLLRATILDKQNNAALLMGYRGCGKSLLLRHVLRNLKLELNPLGYSFVEVYLNGFVQTDDTLAMREICRQLCEENELERLKEGSTFHDMLHFLVDVLEQGHYSNLPIFFVLDEFDLFAQRSKQTLLYNLCDLLQSQSAQIAIVGLTSHFDAYELLEKRIRSRISYRRFLLSHQADVDTLLNVLRSALTITPAAEHEEFNGAIDEFLGDNDLRKCVKRHFGLGRDIRWFFLVCTMAVAHVGPQQPFPRVQHFLDSADHLSTNWLQESLHHCSVVELCMVTAMTHLERIGQVPYNFALCYEAYSKFMISLNTLTADSFPKKVCLKAFEHLVALELANYSEGGSADPASITDKHFRFVRLALDPADVRRMIKEHLDCPTWLEQWATRQSDNQL